MNLTGDNLLEFRSLSAQESAARARELRGRAGWIDLDVFASKTDRAAPAGGEEAMQISLPRLPRRRAPSLKEYQERSRSVIGLKVKARAKARSGLILHTLEPREGGEIKQTTTPLPRGEREKTATH